MVNSRVICVPLLLASIAATTRPTTQQLAAEYGRLTGLSLKELGRDAYAAEFEKFIARAGDDEHAIEAMMWLAGTYGSTVIPEKNIKQDPAKALEWSRRAADAARPGTR